MSYYHFGNHIKQIYNDLNHNKINTNYYKLKNCPFYFQFLFIYIFNIHLLQIYKLKYFLKIQRKYNFYMLLYKV
jgi:hypothetical protein